MLCIVILSAPFAFFDEIHYIILLNEIKCLVENDLFVLFFLNESLEKSQFVSLSRKTACLW